MKRKTITVIILVIAILVIAIAAATALWASVHNKPSIVLCDKLNHNISVTIDNYTFNLLTNGSKAYSNQYAGGWYNGNNNVSIVLWKYNQTFRNSVWGSEYGILFVCNHELCHVLYPYRSEQSCNDYASNNKEPSCYKLIEWMKKQGICYLGDDE